MAKVLRWLAAAVIVAVIAHVGMVCYPVVNTRVSAPFRIREAIRTIPHAPAGTRWDQQQIEAHFWNQLSVTDLGGEVIDVGIDPGADGAEVEAWLVFRHRLLLFRKYPLVVDSHVTGKAPLSVRGAAAD